MRCLFSIEYRYEFDYSWLRMYFIIPIDLQYQTIFDFCGYYNESVGIDLSGRAPHKILFPRLTQMSLLKLGTGILVIYNLIDDVAHAGNKDWGGGLTLHMWTCGITFLAFVCQLTGYLVSFEQKLHLNYFRFIKDDVFKT